MKKALLALLVEYQRRVSELVAYKCRSAKELLLVREVRVALWEHKNECLLPFQKVLPPTFRSAFSCRVSCVVSCQALNNVSSGQTLPAPVTRSEESDDDVGEGEG